MERFVILVALWLRFLVWAAKPHEASACGPFCPLKVEDIISTHENSCPEIQICRWKLVIIAQVHWNSVLIAVPCWCLLFCNLANWIQLKGVLDYSCNSGPKRSEKQNTWREVSSSDPWRRDWVTLCLALTATAMLPMSGSQSPQFPWLYFTAYSSKQWNCRSMSVKQGSIRKRA